VPNMGRTTARCACKLLIAMSTQEVHNSRTELHKTVEVPRECAMRLDKGQDCDELEIDGGESGVLVVQSIGTIV
jgi:uncharacterized Fe-S cluster-containing radical SAM superfamily protein